jgi:hypothetical protein
MRQLTLLPLLSVLVFGACAPAVDLGAVATEAVETHEAQATVTPIPSATPPPATETPTPSPTPTLDVPGDVGMYLMNARVLSKESFDTPAETMDYVLPDMKREDGRLRMQGNNWNGAAWSSNAYEEGTAFVFDMMQEKMEGTPGFLFDVFLESGTWWTEDYQRFGAFIQRVPEADIWVGQNRGSVSGRRLTGDLSIEPGIDYRVLVAVGPDADFLCAIWDPNDANSARTLRLAMGDEWVGKAWKFGLSGKEGLLYVDDFTIMTFDHFK